MKIVAIAHWASLLGANLFRRPHQTATRDDSTEPRRFRHDDWSTLLTHFTRDGRVDYLNFRRVRRVLEAYLERLSYARPDEFADADEQLAFYLNAFNAIAVHQVLLHYPVASFWDIPAAFARPYPVGRELLSLHQLLHGRIRAYGDPRVHAALVPAARSAPGLRAYTGGNLQAELDEQMRALLNDPAGELRVEPATRTLVVPRIFRWYAGDFAAPRHMPSVTMVVRGMLRPALALPFLRPYLPSAANELLNDQHARI
ncbi:MAG: DUF547 domain-containing protein, partial [Chloroflexota bacterium]|nr:DUF547 domain-containing protein [Chloroflexota bacterium]